MKTRLSNKQKWLKEINLTADDELYIGIDVHKKSYHIAFWLNDAPAIDFVTPADNQKTLKILQRFLPAIKLLVYEAGPTGYSLARLLQQNKIPVRIAAPSSDAILLVSLTAIFYMFPHCGLRQPALWAQSLLCSAFLISFPVFSFYPV